MADPGPEPPAPHLQFTKGVSYWHPSNRVTSDGVFRIYGNPGWIEASLQYEWVVDGTQSRLVKTARQSKAVYWPGTLRGVHQIDGQDRLLCATKRSVFWLDPETGLMGLVAGSFTDGGTQSGEGRYSRFVDIFHTVLQPARRRLLVLEQAPTVVRVVQFDARWANAHVTTIPLGERQFYGAVSSLDESGLFVLAAPEHRVMWVSIDEAPHVRPLGLWPGAFVTRLAMGMDGTLFAMRHGTHTLNLVAPRAGEIININIDLDAFASLPETLRVPDVMCPDQNGGLLLLNKYTGDYGHLEGASALARTVGERAAILGQVRELQQLQGTLIMALATGLTGVHMSTYLGALLVTGAVPTAHWPSIMTRRLLRAFAVPE